jgi:hypothetical protein
MKRWPAALLLAVTGVLSSPVFGQCVMCFRTAAAQNAARAHLMNMGIVLLGGPPFAILAGFLFLAWRRNEDFAAAENAETTPTPPEAISSKDF